MDKNETAEELKIKSIEFKVIYANNGGSAQTCFSNDLSVDGAHLSGGEKPFVHPVDDKASKELWDFLEDIAEKVMKIPPISLNPKPDPVLIININFTNGKSLSYERELKNKFNNTDLDLLADILRKNERIYQNQKGRPWVLK